MSVKHLIRSYAVIKETPTTWELAFVADRLKEANNWVDKQSPQPNESYQIFIKHLPRGGSYEV